MLFRQNACKTVKKRDVVLTAHNLVACYSKLCFRVCATITIKNTLKHKLFRKTSMLGGKWNKTQKLCHL